MNHVDLVCTLFMGLIFKASSDINGFDIYPACNMFNTFQVPCCRTASSALSATIKVNIGEMCCAQCLPQSL